MMLPWSRAYRAITSIRSTMCSFPRSSQAVRTRAHAQRLSEVRLVRSEFPVDAIWRAVLDGDDRAIAAIDFADSPVWLRVWRTESGPEIVGLSENERRVLAALFSGQPLHAALAETRGEQTHALRAAQLATAYFENLDHEADGLAQSPEGQTTVSASHERHRRPIGLAVVMESFLACPGGLRARKAQRRKLPCAEDRL